MRNIFRSFAGARQPRGLSQVATIIIAALIVIVGWRLVMFLIGAVTGLLFVAIQIAVMILVFMVLVYAIRTMSKKV